MKDIEFKTIEKENSAEIVEKKSRFIANIYNVESKEEAEEKIQTLDTQVLLLIAMNNMMDDYTGDLVEYSGEYKEDTGTRYQECFKILMRYGWSYEREEADLVYGNHELYKKEF